MTPGLLHHALAFGIDVARLCIWLVLLTLIFVPLERLFALRQNANRRKAIPSDLGFYFLNSLAPALIMAVPLSLLVTTLRQITPETYSHAIEALPFWAILAIGILISEIGTYWGHRWSHEVPLLWRFHSVHHAPEQIDWLINTRAHPFDTVFTRLCGLVPLYVLGFANPAARGDAAMVPVYITLFGTVWAFFVHANVRWRFGPLEQLIATPAFHHWHHTNDAYRDHNYAALFPWVDRLFGSLHLPRQWPEYYGVDDPLPPTMTGQLLHPWTWAPTAGPVREREQARPTNLRKAPSDQH